MSRNVCANRKWDGEKLLPFSELARELIRNPESPVHRSHWSLRRWAIEGVEVNGSGKRIKLPCKMFLGARRSSVQAVREFWFAIVEASE